MTTITPLKPLSVLLAQVFTDIRLEIDSDYTKRPDRVPTDLELESVIETQTQVPDLNQWKAWAQSAGIDPPVPRAGTLSEVELYRLRCGVKRAFYDQHPEIKARLRGNELVQSKLAA